MVTISSYAIKLGVSPEEVRDLLKDLGKGFYPEEINAS